jgi:hypothetical protein
VNRSAQVDLGRPAERKATTVHAHRCARLDLRRLDRVDLEEREVVVSTTPHGEQQAEHDRTHRSLPFAAAPQKVKKSGFVCAVGEGC